MDEGPAPRRRLDDDLLLALGFAPLPVRARRLLLEDVHDELAERIGTLLLADVEDEHVDEFDRLQHDADAARTWLRRSDPAFPQDPAFAAAVLRADDPDAAIRDYAAWCWIRRHHPRVERLVEEQVLILQAELLAQRDGIIRDRR